eukprot:GHVT01096552.1.p1 GENE.GHVT01096552.1~~GHVT01096552.1.p1  ORF type:complete len:133 (+),score=14.39 GHVT01096552.1:215-613(+)
MRPPYASAVNLPNQSSTSIIRQTFLQTFQSDSGGPSHVVLKAVVPPVRSSSVLAPQTAPPALVKRLLWGVWKLVGWRLVGWQLFGFRARRQEEAKAQQSIICKPAISSRQTRHIGTHDEESTRQNSQLLQSL